MKTVGWVWDGFAWRQGQAILSVKWVTAKTKNHFLHHSVENHFHRHFKGDRKQPVESLF